MTRSMRSVLAVCVTATTLVLTACGGTPAPGAGSGEVVPDGELTIALTTAPRAAFAIDTDDAFQLTQLGALESLVATDAQGAPVPALATEWTRVDDLTWRFTLREGVTFHDGTPLTADAVAGALTWLAATPAPPRAIARAGLVVEADPAGGAVVVRTSGPDPILPLRLSAPGTGILAPSAYATTPPAVVGTGTGVMVITQADAAGGVELTRNESYWGERGQLARVSARYVPDAAARALAFRAGDVDVVLGLDESAALEFSASPDVQVQTVPSPRTASLSLNLSAPQFADVRVRQALEAALDRTALGEQALAGSAIPASEWFGPAVPFGSTDAPPAPDLDRARALLAEAGYGPGNPLSFRLWTYANRAELPVLATAVQAMLAEVGVDAQIQVQEYGVMEPEVLAGNFDTALFSRSYQTDVPDAGAALFSDFTCEGTYNLNHYCSAAFDQLVGGLVTVTDQEARQEVFAEAAQLLVDDVAGIPLVHTQETTASRAVSGLSADPTGQTLVTPQLARTTG